MKSVLVATFTIILLLIQPATSEDTCCNNVKLTDFTTNNLDSTEIVSELRQKLIQKLPFASTSGERVLCDYSFIGSGVVEGTCGNVMDNIYSTYYGVKVTEASLISLYVSASGVAILLDFGVEKEISGYKVKLTTKVTGNTNSKENTVVIDYLDNNGNIINEITLNGEYDGDIIYIPDYKARALMISVVSIGASTYSKDIKTESYVYEIIKPTTIPVEIIITIIVFVILAIVYVKFT
jgi:hypothetical protein